MFAVFLQSSSQHGYFLLQGDVLLGQCFQNGNELGRDLGGVGDVSVNIKQGELMCLFPYKRPQAANERHLRGGGWNQQGQGVDLVEGGVEVCQPFGNAGICGQWSVWLTKTRNCRHWLQHLFSQPETLPPEALWSPAWLEISWPQPSGGFWLWRQGEFATQKNPP